VALNKLDLTAQEERGVSREGAFPRFGLLKKAFSKRIATLHPTQSSSHLIERLERADKGELASPFKPQKSSL